MDFYSFTCSKQRHSYRRVENQGCNAARAAQQPLISFLTKTLGKKKLSHSTIKKLHPKVPWDYLDAQEGVDMKESWPGL